MAIYIPAGRRRRRTLIAVGAAFVVGATGGVLVGRSSAPGAADQVAAVRNDARQTAAGLRVLALHDQAGITTSSNDGGADLVLARTRTQLLDETGRAPWLRPAQRDELLNALDNLRAITNRASPEFGAAADGLASRIETTLGS